MAIQWLKGEGWPGVRVALNADKSKTWRVETVRQGVPYRFVLSIKDEDEAKYEWERFETSPHTYVPRVERLKADAEKATAPKSGTRVVLDAETIAAFLSFQKLKGNSPRYIDNLHTYLSLWSVWLDGRDLRDVRTTELEGAITKWKTADKARQIAIKSFASWVRAQHAKDRTSDGLTTGNDPTLALKVRQGGSRKEGREDGEVGYSLEHVAAVYREISEQWARDVLVTLAKSGMHQTEINRVISGARKITRFDKGEIAGAVTFMHKKKAHHTQALDVQACAALQRLRDRKTEIKNHDLLDALDLAAARARVERIRPAEMRHSFVTWALNGGREVRPPSGGVSIEVVSRIVGHTSIDTTLKFYAGTYVPTLIVVPLELTHPDDPR